MERRSLKKSRLHIFFRPAIFTVVGLAAWPLNGSEAGGDLVLINTRAKRLRMRKVSIFKLAVANANFPTRMPVFELKSNFISIQNFKAGNVKPPGMHWSKDF